MTWLSWTRRSGLNLCRTWRRSGLTLDLEEEDWPEVVLDLEEECTSDAVSDLEEE